MKQYDSYKDSGVQWIGKIPSHWNVGNLLYFLRSKICDGPHETPNLVDDGVPFISIDSLNDTCRIDLDVVKKYISEEDYQRYYQKANLEEGDVLFTKAATIGKTAIVGKEKFMVWSPLAILKPNSNLICSKFLYYIVGCSKAVEETVLMGNVNTQVNLGMRDLEKLRIACPSISEQKQIVSFLDKKCEEIDKAMASQLKRIDLLGELRQNIITHAVTRGINPDAPLKDSGVEWIGEVPKHWEVRKLKNICKSEKYAIKTGPFGSQLKGQDLQPEGDVRVYNQRNVIDNQFEETSFFVSYAKAKELENFYTQPSDLLITSRGTIGKCAVLPNDAPMGILHPCLIALRIDQKICSIKWAQLFIGESSCFATNVFLNSNATTIEVIYTETLKDVAIPIPPIGEQKQIVAYVYKQTASIDKSIGKANRQIELLQELKQSIITEVVTGKRKVC